MYKVDLVSPRMLRGTEIERRDEEGRPPNPTFLTSLWNALQWRATTHPQHETPALAILLGINKEVDVDCIGKLPKTFQSRSSDAIVGETLNPNQQWCLDGAEPNLTHAIRRSSWDLLNYSAWLSGWQIQSSMAEKSQS
jgi:hypothetical protein